MDKKCEYKETLDHVKTLINNRINYFVNKMPVIHKIDDGIIIRFFSGWEKDSSRGDFMIKKIKSLNENSKGKKFLAFLPKDTYFEVVEHEHKECLVCLSGQLELVIDNEQVLLDSYNQICIDPNVKHSGKTTKDTYLVVTSFS